MPLPVVDILLSVVGIIPDVLTVHWVLPDGANETRILLWVSWAWFLLRNDHFRINKVHDGDQSAHIQRQRNPCKRFAFKFVLLALTWLLILFDVGVGPIFLHGDFDALNTPIKSYNTTMVRKSKDLWDTVKPHTSYHQSHGASWGAGFILAVNHVMWECVDHHLQGHKSKSEDSISKYIAKPRNKRFRMVLTAYSFLAFVLICVFVGLIPGLIFAIGVCLLIFAKTESYIAGGDEFQTGVHCSGMFIVTGIAIYVFLQQREVLSIVKMSSVLPYLFMFITSVTSHHRLKIRSEVKMFKHLFDCMALLFVRA